ncbi:MAG TPA: hypothetical protein ENK11_09720, partial [Phycisphaerales bacterium]|nr:hypothetical protein [Phycisphaerales bacterium]
MTNRRAMRSVLCMVLVFVCSGVWAQRTATRPAGAMPGRWVRTNPGGGGWFERIAPGPGGAVIACSDLSGVYRSLDGGWSWDCAGPARGLTATHAACAAFDPADPAVVHVGTDEGIFRSTDGGRTYAQTLGDGYVESIAPAADGQTVYAAVHTAWNAAEAHVYVSTDRGETWSRADTGFPPGRRILKLLVSPTDASAVFALTGEGRFAGGPAEIHASTDGGVTWHRVSDTLAGPVADIAFDPAAPGVLYATADDPDPDLPGFVYRSDDGGASWVLLGNHGGALWLRAAAPGVVRVFDPRWQFPWDDRRGVWETADGGQSWSRAADIGSWDTGWSTVYYVLTSSVHSVAVGGAGRLWW